MPRRRKTSKRVKRQTSRGVMKVKQIMVTDVVAIEPNATLTDAAKRMRDANVGMLPIVEAERLRGVVTDRDLVVRAMARDVDPAVTPVRYFESDEIVHVQPESDVQEAMRLMADHQVGRLPVLNPEGRIVGIVTLSSLLLRARRQSKVMGTAGEGGSGASWRSPCSTVGC